MAALDGKYHIKIGSQGYILGRNRNGLQYYEKKKAPAFVNKFGSGDSSYRDATFWQFFAQTNWRNGAQQLKWDDAGKFWKSENVNVNQLEKTTLSNKMISCGQTVAGSNVLVLESWRAGAGSDAFGDGSDGALTISSDTTEAPIDSSCSGTIGTTSLTATNVSFAAGQKILIHQSRGTGAGNYQIMKISAYTAGTITTDYPLSMTYTDSGASQAQVRVLKQYSSVTIDSTKVYSAKTWDGNVGGIIGWLCNGTTTITGTLFASLKGFLGGSAYNYAIPNHQGEGTSGARDSFSTSANGSGGGGGGRIPGPYSGGGGGGANGTSVSDGTYNPVGIWTGESGTVSGNSGLTIMTFGGGGGAGGTLTPQTSGYGGAGGGIILIISKNISVSGAVTSAGQAGENKSTSGSGGGGGAGGSVLIKTQIATLGSGLITASGGAGGSGTYGLGASGGAGRIHLSYSASYSGTTTPTLDVLQDGTLIDNPPDTEFTAYAGTSTGKILSWDGGTAFTEVFDARKLTWYDDISLVDNSGGFGDDGGVEKVEAQSFQLSSALTVKSIETYIKWWKGTPGNVSVRIETNNAGVPSGTLVHADATVTIPAFTTDAYAWKTATFSNAVNLSATTTYWIVLSIAAGANDNAYLWASDSSSPTYASGNRAYYPSWTADTANDHLFRVNGDATSVNCSLVTDVGGTHKMLFGVGNPSSTTNGEARIISYDGTTWAINKIFTTTYSSQVTSLEEYTVTGTDKVFVGVGPQAVVYSSTDLSTYTEAKDINKPQNPGYIWKLKEYNHYLYALGGSPELLQSQNYDGFVYIFDTTEWNPLYPFDFTTIRSAEFYDAYLFMGTYHGQLFVYDTSSLTPIFNFKDLYDYEVTIRCMKYFDDKLYLGLIPQDGTGETNVGVWVYDRRGLSLAYHNSGVTGYYCMSQVNNELLIGASDGYVYRIDRDKYQASGSIQSSYYDANLPSIPKLYSEVTLQHDPLPANTSIAVYYQFKESDTPTLLGTSSTDDAEEATFSFASGTTSNKISLKYVLSTSDEDVTPSLTEVVMKYSLMPQRKWLWNMRIMAKSNLILLDKTTSSLTATQIRSAVETAQNSDSLVVLTDFDGTTYNCLFNDIQQPSWVIDQDTASEDLINVSLIEA